MSIHLRWKNYSDRMTQRGCQLVPTNWSKFHLGGLKVINYILSSEYGTLKMGLLMWNPGINLSPSWKYKTEIFQIFMRDHKVLLELPSFYQMTIGVLQNYATLKEISIYALWATILKMNIIKSESEFYNLSLSLTKWSVIPPGIAMQCSWENVPENNTM